MRRRADALFAGLFLINDVVMVALAFYLAYLLRITVSIPPVVDVGPFGDYAGMMAIQVATMVVVYFFSRLYDL